MWEGIVTDRRVSEKENPPFKLVGIWADYDSPAKHTDVASAVAYFASRGVRHIPNYIGRSLSGYLHCVWLIEKPVIVASTHIAKKLLERIFDGLELGAVHPNADKTAFIRPTQLLTNACDWVCLDADRRVSSALITGWHREIVEKTSRVTGQQSAAFKGDRRDRIIETLKSKYPRFADWPGEFEVGSQGPTFWIANSVSPGSAIVKDDGIYTFANHAPKAWYPWDDAALAGSSLVKEIDAEAIGRAVEGIYFDGGVFWRHSEANESWEDWKMENHKIILETTYGLSSTVAKGQKGPSELKCALAHTMTCNRIKHAAPYPFSPQGVFFDEDVRGKVLNLSHAQVMQPAEDTGQVWGPEGKFPWISEFLDGLLTGTDALQSILAWLRHIYSSGLKSKPASGQAIFIAGPAGKGKTFFSTRICSPLLGGHTDASSYMTGESPFNAQLYRHGLWTIDDAAVAQRRELREAFVNKVKRAVANPSQECHEKFKTPVNVTWRGRLVVTLNTDPRSLRMLPVVDGTVLDKICLYRLNEETQPNFLPDGESERVAMRELPFFARWLLEWVPPARLVGEPRFGVQPYLDQSLLLAASAGSVDTQIRELVLEFFDTYFTGTPRKTSWEGTARILRKQLQAISDDELKYCPAQELEGYLTKFSAIKEFPYELTFKEADQVYSRRWVATLKNTP
jgi:hypothetical protein